MPSLWDCISNDKGTREAQLARIKRYMPKGWEPPHDWDIENLEEIVKLMQEKPEGNQAIVTEGK